MTEKIGIVGFGVVGKSVLEFFNKFYPKVQIGIWDQRKLEVAEIDLLKSFSATFFDSAQFDLKKFFEAHDQIILSPGVNLRKYFNSQEFEIFKEKCSGELDYFAKHFTKPTIAITGTLGKTTITKLLGNLTPKAVFENNGFERVKKGGNIGDAMLKLIDQQTEVDLAVLELSSFQLDLNKHFAPTVALWTNFYPNHLDWHPDLLDYFFAKCKIFEHQKPDQFAILPINFLSMRTEFVAKIKSLKSTLCFICDSLDNSSDLVKKIGIKNCFLFHPQDGFFCLSKIEDGILQETNQLFELKFLPEISYTENWFFVLAALHLLKLDVKNLEKYFYEKELFLDDEKFCEHRLELFANINGIDFYNDSKATVVQATKAALKKLEKNGKPIILIVGGLGKGVDRSSFFKSLSENKAIKKMFFLGKPSKEFESFHVYSSLQDVLNDIFQIAKPGDQVLFSPSGSSFDFFKDYQHRGKVFKELVLSFGQI